MAKFFGIGILSIILLSNAIPIFSQTKSTQKNLQTRIQELEKENQELKSSVERLEGLRGIFEKHSALLEKDSEKTIKDLNDRFNLKAMEIDYMLKYNTWEFWIAILAIVASLFGGYKTIRSNIEEKAIEYSDKALKESFEKQKEDIIKVAAIQREENQFRNNKKILVLREGGERETFLKELLEVMEFKKVEYDSFDKDKAGEAADLIVFDSEGHCFNETHLLQYIEKINDETMCFIFAQTISNTSDIMKNDRVACGSMKPQLYGNIIDALRYQDKILKKS